MADPNFRHTPACIEARKAWKRADAQWREQWPNFCRECEGGGVCAAYDDCYSCEACLEKEICSRCAAAMPKGEWPCPACDYDGDTGRPDEPICDCTGDGVTTREKFH